jgi:hypothetical protein
VLEAERGWGSQAIWKVRQWTAQIELYVLARSQQRPRVQSLVDSFPIQGRIFLFATIFFGETMPLRQRRGLAVRRWKRAWLHVASAAGNECIEAETQQEPWCGC